MRGDHWGEVVEERTSDGWRVELAILRAKAAALAPVPAPSAVAGVPAPLAAVAEARQRGDTTAAYAAAQQVRSDADRQRAFGAVDSVVDGKPVRVALAVLSPPTPTPDAPAPAGVALSLFPPGPIEAAIGAMTRRLDSGTPKDDDAAWAQSLRPQLDAARAGMQPDVNARWSARLDALIARLAPAPDQTLRAAEVGAVDVPADTPVVIATHDDLYAQAERGPLAEIMRLSPQAIRLLFLSLLGSMEDCDDRSWLWERLTADTHDLDTHILAEALQGEERRNT